VALSATQLERLLNDPAELEAELGFPVSREIIDANVTRAINLKLGKMTADAAGLHSWFTYWLVAIRAIPAGAGLIGFKGCPGLDGRAEVGYGLGPAYRDKGYMTEALGAMSQWAFRHPECRALTASAVSNPASEKVLQKSGWHKVSRSEKSSNWELTNSSSDGQPNRIYRRE